MDKLNLKKSQDMWKEALDLVPGGVLGIRRPYNFVPGEYPYFLSKGKGGHVWDVDGNEYIDFLCAYGPIILGHREAEIDDAVCEQMKKGFCFNLCQPWQNALAKKLRQLIPCAEQSFFVKTGSDATSSTVRIARGHTKRSKILRCGYHGWHDWCAEVHGGIPESVYKETLEFEYNDLESLERLLLENKGEVAGIIITPVGHPLAKPIQTPKAGFLEGVRRLADEHGAVLIFDEIRSGFRVSLGGAGAKYGVIPDLAVFGKAMANGYAIAAVCGKRGIMKCLADAEVFISSTYFPNSLEIVAALKTIEILEREKAVDDIWKKGEAFLREISAIAEKSGTGARVSGIPPMPAITFDADPQKKYKERRTLFYTEAIRRGIFMQPYHHSYIAYRHTEADLKKAVTVIGESLAAVAKAVP
jgi:glutamate-1-semialdehyde aminotransferase